VPALEGARGIAALGVLAFHVGVPGSSRLWLGVPLFFLLSGFLLFRPFARAIIEATPLPSLRRYGRARLLRIVPAYWVVLTFLIVDEGLYPGGRHAIPIWHLAAHYLLIYTLFDLGSIVGGGWTLCVEVAFYAALPLFALAVSAITRPLTNRRQRTLLLALTLLPAFPVSQWYMENEGFGSGWLPPWLPGYLDEFAIGMLLAIFLEVRPRLSLVASRMLLVSGVLLGVGAQWLYTFGSLDPYGNGSGAGYSRVMELAFAFVLASVLARGESTVLGRLLASRLLLGAGTVSYAVYLWNLAVIDRLRGTGLWFDNWAGLVLATAAVLLIARTSWVLIERPALRLKDARPRVTSYTAALTKSTS